MELMMPPNHVQGSALGNVGERGEGACLSGLGLNYLCPVGEANGADRRRLLRGGH